MIYTCRTHFHCITTCVAFLGEIRQSICLFCGFVFSSQMALLSNINFYFDCKTRLCLIVPDRQEKIFAEESFYLQGILDDINEKVFTAGALEGPSRAPAGKTE